jgi:hypothetical protein
MFLEIAMFYYPNIFTHNLSFPLLASYQNNLIHLMLIDFWVSMATNKRGDTLHQQTRKSIYKE